MSKKQAVKTRTNKKLDLERKRDEKAVRRALAKERKNRPQEGSEDEEFLSFANQLLAMGLKLREVPGDGNCLFRALGDQLEGHSRNHLKHRRETVDFMIKHRQDFEPFVEDDVPFDRYVANLEKPGTFVGNDVIVAFARNNQVNIVIHQLNAPLWQVFGTRKSNAIELHIAYRYGEHYDSVRMLNDNSEAPANLKTEMLIKDEGKKKDRNKISPYQMEDIRDFEREVTKTDLDDAIQKVRNATGCMDTDVIIQNLEAENYNIGSVIFAILQTDELKNSNSDEDSNKTSSNCSPPNMSPLWMENGTGNRIFGNHTVNAEEFENNRWPNDIEENKRTKNKVTNKQRKEQQRLEKKKRQEERHRQKVLESRSNNMEDNGTDRDFQAPVTLVKTFTTLNI
ncbi:OTU domain-containing protein 3 [Stegostoma tigrinum]|uniref:OTU domain-containing protein 3 n=1 Tax=Stegostoma tigrinum TaxID=3053191 RepID=UPI00202B1C50|nr:OTU domain-containing protein 3 [Stegostoma tigrinum]XP_048417431.1 OTU domain-containing protein 3 [Stegostoma tigrinum]